MISSLTKFEKDTYLLHFFSQTSEANLEHDLGRTHTHSHPQELYHKEVCAQDLILKTL